MTVNCSSSCSTRGDLPWEGTGASLNISGCRFSLYPMADNYADMILEALKKADTSKIWCESDALSTVYRGKLNHVMDSLRGIFINAYDKDVHMALEGQISKGCPGDTDGDSYINEDDTLVNYPLIADKNFPVKCKFALYPLGVNGYIDHIAHVFKMAEDYGLSPSVIHYATRISGDVHQVFYYLEAVGKYCAEAVPHYVLTFTLSVNSPTEEV